MSVLGGCINPMASEGTDTATVAAGDTPPRRRGKSKAPNFKYDGPVAVIRLELDLCDPVVRRRLERQWEAVFRLRRALQHDAQARCRAYWAAHHQRAADPKALRERLGLTRKGIEAAAKRHIEASGWMRDHLTKAIGLHVADEVWETVNRHLFADASGRRHGPPRVGSWWDFSRIPGRARLERSPHQNQADLGDLPASRDAGRAPRGSPAPATAGRSGQRNRGCRLAGGNFDFGPTYNTRSADAARQRLVGRS